MKEKVVNMTKGHPLKLILYFSLPLMLGNVFQQLYTVVDTMIVGQGVGVDALAALGASDWFNWMILGIITGFTQGFSILVSHYFGANDTAGVRKAMALSIKFGCIIGLILTGIALFLAKPILILLQTPSDILELSLLYLRIMFSGSIIVMAYNTLSSILRALGDSRTPLKAMIVASILNVILDLLFVLVFHWGVAGAAIATLLGQLSSAIYCFIVMYHMHLFHFEKDDFKTDFSLLPRMFRLGSLMAFQNTVISIGGMVVQSIVNSFGLIYVAGFTATNKLYGLLELAATSFGFALSTYAGQNLGAKNYSRIELGMQAALKLALGTSFVISILMICFGKIFLGWFISGTPEEVQAVLNVAYRYLFVMAIGLWILYLLHVYRSALQGMGDTLIPMISGLAEFFMRISIALFLPRLIGKSGIYFAEVVAWIGAVIILIPSYYAKIKHLKHLKES